ncbi:KAT8 regulatory NSL complex subunit dim gamma-tubulin 1 [Dermatophagoides pteronyssinus]|uniref:KAT8 regulatory NSL complex subunit dim gamma-tubulin 1 n=1 Tax=Dermatophagoides pteronyssinus TaxID=6956 RepID=UPI003F66A125
MSYKSQNSSQGKSNRSTACSSSSHRSQQQQLIYLKRQSSLFNQFLHHQQRPNSHQTNADNFCLYPHRFCLQNRLENYNYCIRHILFDKNAPFKQCSYIHPQTNKRCPKAARRYDRRDRDTAFCPWHIQQFNLLRRKNACMENYQNSMADGKKTSLKRKFEELEHYCPSDEHDHRRKNGDWELPDYKSVVPSKALKTRITDSINAIHYQSQNNDDFSHLMLADVLNLDSLDSDNESVESYMDDPLRHAGVYSAEEISHILRDKMLRLQTLYINLLNYYRQMLKQKMRQYYLAKLSAATNKLCENQSSNGKTLESSSTIATINDSNTIIDALNEDQDYKIMKAMFKYHNFSGSEKLIQKKASEIRQNLIEDKPVTEKSSTSSTCIYKKDAQQCQKQCVPLSNYCRTHILYDPYQILYRPCANGTPPCLMPVVSYVHRNSCLRHTQIKFEKNEITKIMKSPEKLEPKYPDQPINDDDDLENETELFHSIEDISMAMDPVESENLFSLEHEFDIDSNMLS